VYSFAEQTKEDVAKYIVSEEKKERRPGGTVVVNDYA